MSFSSIHPPLYFLSKNLNDTKKEIKKQEKKLRTLGIGRDIVTPYGKNIGLLD